MTLTIFSISGNLEKDGLPWDGAGELAVIHKGVAVPMPFAGRWTKDHVPGYLSLGLSSADHALHVVFAAIGQGLCPNDLLIQKLRECQTDADLKELLNASGVEISTDW